MAKNSVQLNLPPSLVKTLDPASQSLDRAGQSELTSMLAEAVDAARVSDKEAARDMGYDPAYWTRIKNGEKQAHLDRLSRLPATVQREFVRRYASELKMTVQDEDATKQAVVDLVAAAVRMLERIA